MVTRPPLTIVVEPMRVEDLPAIHEIERQSFTTPWPPHAYRAELEANRLAHYLVVRVDGQLVGYAGMWLMVDEAHITTFAVHPAWRRQRIAERLLLVLLDLGVRRHAREATLEVRLSNIAARRLYEKFGFRPVGIRPRYYSDDNEDALIMTTETLDGPQMTARIERLRAYLEAAAPPVPHDDRCPRDDDVHSDDPASPGTSTAGGAA
jgi:ribosomal-protein-alanine N-acetyltransferase